MEVDDFSQPLEVVLTDELLSQQAIEHDHRTMLYDKEYVSEDSDYTN